MNKTAQSKLYRIWCGIRQRCNNPNHASYKNYGGRGITLSKDWSSYDNFYQDVIETYNEHVSIHGEKDTTIDRIDSNGDYCVSNVRWSTQLKQQQNRRNTVYLEYKGKRQSIFDWQRELSLPRGLVQSRIKRGWTIAEALETPSGTILKPRKLLSNEHRKKISLSMKAKTKIKK